ncbi:MAG: Dna2/Cas4 domain-containing protein [Candidatus Hadarchaeota archaeon]
MKIPLNDKTRVLQIISDIRETISKESFPPPTKYKKRCVDCCYRKMCWAA